MACTKAWYSFSKAIVAISFATSCAALLLIAIVFIGHIAWYEVQQNYLDVKEYNKLRNRSDDLTKREKVFLKMEARIKELEEELDRTRMKKGARTPPKDKAPPFKVNFVAPATASKNLGWFSELRAVYSYMKACYKSSPRTSKYWNELGDRAAAIENGDIAVIKELKGKLEGVELGMRDLTAGLENAKGQAGCRNGAGDSQIKQILEAQSSFKTDIKARAIGMEAKVSDIKIVAKEFNAHLIHYKLETDAHIKWLSRQVSELSKQARERSRLKDERRSERSAAMQTADIKGKGREASEKEIPDHFSKNEPEQGCLMFAEYTKSLEREKGQPQSSNEGTKTVEVTSKEMQSDEEYDVVQMPVVKAKEA